MRSAVESFANIAIGVAALAVVSTLGLRAWRSRGVEPSYVEAQPEYVGDWQDILKAGLLLDGAAPRKVTIIVFSDLECPFCAQFHLETQPVLERLFGDTVGTVFVHFPIRSHRFAMQSAQALECAADRGLHRAFLELVYRRQDSIGLKPWAEYAASVGVADTTEFMECVRSPTKRRILDGKELGERFDLRATPTILVDGWRFVGVPDSATIVPAIRAILAGQPPIVGQRPATKSGDLTPTTR
ncbi:MAG: thioredoxin domain-containing protein [Gemmatimonadaceae bacterium]|nr:thioredoxin domain-containing protein [Gemmatimonadaceae bacterium]